MSEEQVLPGKGWLHRSLSISLVCYGRQCPLDIMQYRWSDVYTDVSRVHPSSEQTKDWRSLILETSAKEFFTVHPHVRIQPACIAKILHGNLSQTCIVLPRSRIYRNKSTKLKTKTTTRRDKMSVIFSNVDQKEWTSRLECARPLMHSAIWKLSSKNKVGKIQVRGFRERFVLGYCMLGTIT